MIGRAPGPLRGDIVLRDVTEEDLPIFFDGSVAGHVSSFESSGKRELSYWIGKR